MNRLATINKPTTMTKRKTGFPSIFDDLENFGRNLWLFNSPFEDFSTDISFPKYNVKQTENGLELDIALAGYDKDTINIELSPQNILTVSSEKIEEDGDVHYHRKDIAMRKFEIKWKLDAAQEIGDITFVNGILHIPIHNGDPKKDVKRLNIL